MLAVTACLCFFCLPVCLSVCLSVYLSVCFGGDLIFLFQAFEAGVAFLAHHFNIPQFFENIGSIFRVIIRGSWILKCAFKFYPRIASSRPFFLNLKFVRNVLTIIKEHGNLK
jgi:hypothetical protein